MGRSCSRRCVSPYSAQLPTTYRLGKFRHRSAAANRVSACKVTSRGCAHSVGKAAGTTVLTPGPYLRVRRSSCRPGPKSWRVPACGTVARRVLCHAHSCVGPGHPRRADDGVVPPGYFSGTFYFSCSPRNAGARADFSSQKCRAPTRGRRVGYAAAALPAPSRAASSGGHRAPSVDLVARWVVPTGFR